METTNHWRKKSKKSIDDGKISHAHGLSESILWKWYITKSNLHVHCSPHQNSNDNHHRDWKIYPNWEAQMTSSSRGNAEWKAICWRYHNTRLQTVLQSLAIKTAWYCHKKSWRPMEQNRIPIFESIQIHPLNFWQKHRKYVMEKR
jgi:hypothetical protein